MQPSVGFDFETAKEILRLVKKNKNGSLNRPIESETPNLNDPQMVIAFVSSSVITVYNDDYKLLRIPNAYIVPFQTGFNSTYGRLAFGGIDYYGDLDSGSPAIVGLPVINEPVITAPRIFAGHYLGVITGYSETAGEDFEKPIVLILYPHNVIENDSEPITVVTNVTCTPEGIQLTTAQFVASDYDAAVITSFLGLNDTPASYSAQQNRVVKVNANADGLEFGINNDTVQVDISDMQAAIASLQSEVASLQADYITLEARVTALE